MHKSIQFKPKNPSLLEKFGIYYLRIFRKKDLSHRVFDLSDEELSKRMNRISNKGIFLSALVGIICVWPIVYVDLLKANEPWYLHYSWVIGVTVVASLIEFYFLFLIALKVVHNVSELINMRANKKEFLQSGPFSITNILARTALEIPDPELHILGIDPFKRISKKNLLILGLLYKFKIALTNIVLKFLLRTFVGKTIAGISINYIALPVECFWNAVVIRRVVKEARLRMFGFALCNYIADEVIHDGVLDQLSSEAVDGCMRAIGNAVVMAQNYHPNMIILLLRFEHLLHVNHARHYDDWNLFLATLQKVSEKERNLILDVFTIAASFDGRISRLEAKNIKDAYGEYYELYLPRLEQLTHHLRSGELHAAADLCKIDFTAG
ncbi:MAG: hypothetical protein C5B59_14805 [Bacteroidetes bacterium]|nr:MAG: hypothetical protein C5B59_14805 [Bacteroidota bacterium]